MLSSAQPLPLPHCCLLRRIGPGFITAVVDNDAGGIVTYSQAGARFGYLPLWTLLPITVMLILTQEMCSRMGAVTGKGLARPDPRRVRPAQSPF